MADDNQVRIVAWLRQRGSDFYADCIERGEHLVDTDCVATTAIAALGNTIHRCHRGEGHKGDHQHERWVWRNTKDCARAQSTGQVTTMPTPSLSIIQSYERLYNRAGELRAGTAVTETAAMFMALLERIDALAERLDDALVHVGESLRDDEPEEAGQQIIAKIKAEFDRRTFNAAE